MSGTIQRVISKIFFDHMEDGLDLFVSALGFRIVHQDGDLAVVERDGAKIYVVQSPEYAAKDRPEISIETGTIDDFYADIQSRRPDLLHPNLKQVQLRPWGAREFALLDKTGVCVVFRQW